MNRPFNRGPLHRSPFQRAPGSCLYAPAGRPGGGGGGVVRVSAATQAFFYGQVGTRCYVPTAIGDNLQYQFQSGHDIYVPTAGTYTIYIAEPNFWVSNTTWADTGTGGTLTASMGVEFPASTFTRATWVAGATSASIASGTIGWAQVTLTLPAGKSRIRLIRRLQNSNAIALNRQANGARRYLAGGDDIAEQSSTDRTLTGGLTDSAGDFMVWPGGIVTLTTGVSLGGIGDSRLIGERDDTPSDEHQGQLFHYFGPNYAYQNQGVAGQPFVTAANSTLRRQLLQYCTTILSVNGFNSRTSSGATMFAAMMQEGADMAPREFWPGTIYPAAGSTDGWTALTNQSPDGFNNNRNDHNDLVLAQGRKIDPNGQLESSLHSGKIIAHTPGYFNDGSGVHLTSAGCALLSYAGFSPASPASIASSLVQVAPS